MSIFVIIKKIINTYKIGYQQFTNKMLIIYVNKIKLKYL
jgi:hypothetical protein